MNLTLLSATPCVSSSDTLRWNKPHMSINLPRNTGHISPVENPMMHWGVVMVGDDICLFLRIVPAFSLSYSLFVSVSHLFKFLSVFLSFSVSLFPTCSAVLGFLLLFNVCVCVAKSDWCVLKLFWTLRANVWTSSISAQRDLSVCMCVCAHVDDKFLHVLRLRLRWLEFGSLSYEEVLDLCVSVCVCLR